MNTMKTLDELIAIRNKLCVQYKCALKGSAVAEAQCQDLDHFIEEYQYNAIQGAKAMKLLRECRKQRRNYKDAVSMLAMQKDNLTKLIEKCQKKAAEAETHSTWQRNKSGILTDLYNIKSGGAG